MKGGHGEQPAKNPFSPVTTVNGNSHPSRDGNEVHSSKSSTTAVDGSFVAPSDEEEGYGEKSSMGPGGVPWI